MAKSSSVSGAGHVLGSRYATSLIEAARQANAIPAVEKDMKALQAMLGQSSELMALINSPVYSKDQQHAALQTIGQKTGFHAVSLNFLGVLAVKGRLMALPLILSVFFLEMEKLANVIEAKVVSAFPLTDAQQKELTNTLSTKTGKSVRLDLQIDKSLLGGMVVTVGSRMIDDSLKTRLEQLKQAMVVTKAA